jgi:two-component system chemotaxis response regulator CheB
MTSFHGESPPTAVVVIGASAMELGAFAQLLAALPETLPAAVLVAMHSIQAAHGPALLRVLMEESTLPCGYAVDQEALAAGHVYIAPADKHLLVQDGRMRVVFGPKENGHRPAVDALLRTVAHDWGPRAIGVVLCGLSGQITDGLSGLWRMKERGGTVVVPHAAGSGPVETGTSAIFQRVTADFTPTTEELPALLLKLANERKDLQT